MAQRTVVVIGGAMSGPTAAARAREVDDDARIVLVEQAATVSYATCGLAYHLSGEVDSVTSLDRERADFFETVYRVDVRTRTEVVAIDPAGRMVAVRGANGEERLSYDALVFALGAESRFPNVLGIEGANVRSLRTIEDVETIRSTLDAGGRRVVVLGGGVLGIEASDGLVRGGARVTVVERRETLLPRFGREASELARQALARKADVRTGVSVAGVAVSAGLVVGVDLSSGERIDTDLVVVATGVVPRTAILKAVGAKLATDGTVVVDDHARTSLDGVFACGACVSLPEAVTGRPVWWPQGAIADRTAQVAGANAAGGDARLEPVAGSMLVRVVETTAGRTGLAEHEARDALGAANVGVTTIHARSHEVYFPGSMPMFLSLVWDRRDGRAVGFEAVGPEGVDKRVDVAATAIAGQLPVEALAGLDLGFAPPFSPARDPLCVAANLAAMERAGLCRAMSAETLRGRLGGVQLLDVRGAGAIGDAIPGAVRIPFTTLRDRLGEIDPARTVVAYSRSGRRGFSAARVLARRGFRDVWYLAGGLASWGIVEQSHARSAAAARKRQLREEEK